MFGHCNGVDGPSTSRAIEHVTPPIDLQWKRTLRIRPDVFGRPIGHGKSVFYAAKDNSVIRADEEGERKTGWKLDSACALMRAFQYLLVPMHQARMGLLNTETDEALVVRKLSDWVPLGAWRDGNETVVHLPNHVLVCETGELRPNEWYLRGNMYDRIHYGEVWTKGRNKKLIGTGAFDPATGDWLWQRDDVVCADWVGTDVIVVQKRLPDGKTQAEAWDRETHEPLWQLTPVQATGLFNDRYAHGRESLIDVRTGETLYPLPYAEDPVFIMEDRYLWYRRLRLANDRREQAIVCFDFREQEEVSRLELPSTGRRSRADFRYTDGCFYRVCDQRLECYGAAK